MMMEHVGKSKIVGKKENTTCKNGKNMRQKNRCIKEYHGSLSYGKRCLFSSGSDFRNICICSVSRKDYRKKKETEVVYEFYNTLEKMLKSAWNCHTYFL